MPEQISKQLLERFSEFVAARMGLRFAPEQWRDLERNMRAAAAELGFKTVEECIAALLSANLTHAQLETLAIHLTVGETYFFREKHAFDFLAERVIPDWLETKSEEKRLRIWSAGCCSGEEPYSIAMLLGRTIPNWKNWNIQILATDINSRFLEKASRGIYNEWSFRDTLPGIKQNCFRELSHGVYEILPQFKEMVEFKFLNLAGETYPSAQNDTAAMDLIFCRNVLMYFSPEKARETVQRLHRATSNGGWLFVSATETSPELYQGFEPRNFKGFTFYKKERRKSQSRVHRPPRFAPVIAIETNHLSLVENGNLELPLEKSAPKKTEFDEALEQIQSGNFSEAANRLARWLEKNPRDEKAAALLAQTCADQGKLGDALSWCEKAFSINKINPQLCYLRATILQEQGDFEGSIAALKQTLYLDPDFALANFALGNLALKKNKLNEARKHFRNALTALGRMNPEQALEGSGGLTVKRLGKIIAEKILAENAV